MFTIKREFRKTKNKKSLFKSNITALNTKSWFLVFLMNRTVCRAILTKFLLKSLISLLLCI